MSFLSQICNFKRKEIQACQFPSLTCKSEPLYKDRENSLPYISEHALSIFRCVQEGCSGIAN